MTNNQETGMAISRLDIFRSTITKMSSEFASILPAKIPAARFIRTAITTVQMNPALLDADRKSLLATCMLAAQDGLLLDGREAAAVMYYDARKGTKTVSYIPMAHGILKKIQNSGQIKTIYVQAVHENDYFDYECGDNPYIRHKPLFGINADRGDIYLYYAIAHMTSGAVYRRVMTLQEIHQRRDKSKTYQNNKSQSMWSIWPREMEEKTILKKLAQMLPMSRDEIGVSINADDHDEHRSDLQTEEIEGAIKIATQDKTQELEPEQSSSHESQQKTIRGKIGLDETD